jgi:hypothetical protein
MVSRISGAALPYQTQVNGIKPPKVSARTMADWGSPLPTRKLAPYEDVQFDPALQPRAHRMTGKVFLAHINMRPIADCFSNIERFKDIDSGCANVGNESCKLPIYRSYILTILAWTRLVASPLGVMYMYKVCKVWYSH